MDTIDVSNLNRQFVSAKRRGWISIENCGQVLIPRAELRVIPHVGKIAPPEWYKGGEGRAAYEGFSHVAGLDNGAAVLNFYCSFVELDEDGDVDDRTRAP